MLSGIEHRPVLVSEVGSAISSIESEKIIIVDGTFGYGGHFRAIQSLLGSKLKAYYGIEQDLDTLEAIKSKFKQVSSLQLIYGNFRKLDLLIPSGVNPNVVLFDLGTSIPQLTSEKRGLSLFKDAPLDMRLNPEFQRDTAVDVLKKLSKKDLEAALITFTNIRKYRTLSNKLKEFVYDKKTTKTTFGLLSYLKPYLPSSAKGKVHPATTLFQCLRILVNDEMGAIEEGFKKAVQVLASKGRLLVISFHSTEHRLVKQLMQSEKACGKLLTKKAIVPSEMELRENPASRSSQLRIFEKK